MLGESLSQADEEVERLKAKNAALYRLLAARTAEADESLQQLSQILTSIPDALIVTDDRDRVKLVNRPVARMFGVGEWVVGQPLDAHFAQDLAALLTDARTSGLPVDGTVALHDDRIGEAHCNPLRGDDGTPTGAVVVVRDVTYERELGQMKNDFIANVSHELRTPLTSILGFANLVDKRLDKLLPRIPDPEPRARKHMAQVSENIGIIVTESERLKALVDDILDLSQLEAGATRFRFEALPVDGLVRKAAQSCEGRFAPGVTLSTSVAIETPQVRGDAGKLVEVLEHLLSNAAKFTREGTVDCTAEPTTDGVLFQVADTGPGIPEDAQDTIFERFRQVGDTLTAKPVGTGVGLALCREIVAGHDGTLSVESEPGVGTTFSFVIPAWEG